MFCFVYETWSHNIALAGIELTEFCLSLTTSCWVKYKGSQGFKNYLWYKNENLKVLKMKCIDLTHLALMTLWNTYVLRKGSFNHIFYVQLF